MWFVKVDLDSGSMRGRQYLIQWWPIQVIYVYTTLNLIQLTRLGPGKWPHFADDILKLITVGENACIWSHVSLEYVTSVWVSD